MQARMNNPAMVLPDAMQAMLALNKAIEATGVPKRTLGLIHLRISQINGCSVCCHMGGRHLKQAGETDDRLFALATWRDAPFFTEAERAALALAEATTRLADRPDPVSDAVWAEAARHYDERALAGLVYAIAATNVWNRTNAVTRQIAGAATW